MRKLFPSDHGRQRGSTAIPRSVATLLVLSLICGCSRFPQPPTRPSLDAGEASSQAVQSLDTSGDGSIDREEAAAAPGLLAAFEAVDADASGQLSPEEIEARCQAYQSSPTIVTGCSIAVLWNNRPLPGATVILEPEGFLGDVLPTAQGTTDRRGETFVVGPDARYPGVFLGMYRVRISRQAEGKEMIPSQYNKETTLGIESFDNRGGDPRPTIFRLSDRN